MKEKKRLCEQYFTEFNELSDWCLDNADNGLEVVNVFQQNGIWVLIYFENYYFPLDKN